MKKFSSILLILTVILGVMGCNDRPNRDRAQKQTPGNPTQPFEKPTQPPKGNLQAQKPDSINNGTPEEIDPNADIYQAGKFTVTLGTTNEGKRTYRGCDLDGNCVELEGGSSWQDKGKRGMTWRNGEYAYAVSWQEGTTGPMYLNVYNNNKQLLREPMIPLSNRYQATAVAMSESERGEVLDYFYKNREALKLCEPTLDPEHSQQSSEIYPVGEGKYLVKVSCFLAAYQEGFEFWLYEKTPQGIDVKPLTLTRFNAVTGGKPNPDEIRTLGGMSRYNPANKTVTIFTKFRGLGDCGSIARYQFQNNSLDLVSYKAKYDCDGNYVDPEQYRQIYP